MESSATAAPPSLQARGHRFYWDRVWNRAAATVLFCATCPSHCHAAPPDTDRLYVYTDERGVSNFSDAPSDPRHRLILESRPRAAAATAAPGRTLAARHRVPDALSPLIREAAARHRLDPALVQAVAFVESRFEPRARSPKGALGLMQLMPATAARFGVTDPWDARQNLGGGARYLRELLDRFDDSLPLALAAYNAGEGAVERHGKRIPPYGETQAYVPRVMSHYELLITGAAPAPARNGRVPERVSRRQ